MKEYGFCFLVGFIGMYSGLEKKVLLKYKKIKEKLFFYEIEDLNLDR